MSKIGKRKTGHVDVCLNENVSYNKSTGLEKYDFVHCALPNINFDDISTNCEFLGKKLSMPLIISGMTGGGSLSRRINKTLAAAAQSAGIAMGLGSQRIAFEKPEMLESFKVRDIAADIVLLANLGAVQLNHGFGIKEAKHAVESIGADALVFHLNPMQEVIQGGQTEFAGLLKKIEAIVKELPYPVIVKEVGFGISGKAGKKLSDAGVYAIDVSGAGGTSWSAVESYLVSRERQRLGRLFWDWGVPTAYAIKSSKNLKCRLIAGGGIRSGLDIAKALALGADYATIAGPFLKAALKGKEEVLKLVARFELELKTAMFGTGAKTLEQLKTGSQLILKDKFYE